mmetsp:Transcript_18404/g.51132  ORF Transcript_18404/g.51132 Transcript_18404/m.51132 type:complete len:247 (+) Transcript_18404:1162-1902(+)
MLLPARGRLRGRVVPGAVSSLGAGLAPRRPPLHRWPVAVCAAKRRSILDFEATSECVGCCPDRARRPGSRRRSRIRRRRPGRQGPGRRPPTQGHALGPPLRPGDRRHRRDGAGAAVRRRRALCGALPDEALHRPLQLGGVPVSGLPQGDGVLAVRLRPRGGRGDGTGTFSEPLACVPALRVVCVADAEARGARAQLRELCVPRRPLDVRRRRRGRRSARGAARELPTALAGALWCSPGLARAPGFR